MRPMHPLRKGMAAAGTHRLTMRPGNAARPPVYGLVSEKTEAAEVVPNARDAETARVEAVLFLAEEPLPLKRIAEAASLKTTEEARRCLDALKSHYEADETAFHIEELAGGYQLLTRPAHHAWLLRLRRTGYDLRLTPTLWETLAAIAYKQPITRADLEAIRGTGAAETLRILTEKGLVRSVGREQSLGRPQLYGTTKTFLQAFGLRDLDDLPKVERLTRT